MSPGFGGGGFSQGSLPHSRWVGAKVLSPEGSSGSLPSAPEADARRAQLWREGANQAGSPGRQGNILVTYLPLIIFICLLFNKNILSARLPIYFWGTSPRPPSIPRRRILKGMDSAPRLLRSTPRLGTVSGEAFASLAPQQLARSWSF